MDFVAYYYGFLPEDTESGWRLLSSDLQQRIGIDSYNGFWRSVQDVQVDSTRPSGPDGVAVTLTYTTSNGTEQETRLLHVQRSENGYVISGDDGAI